MRAIAVDDEKLAIELLRSQLAKVPRITEINAFTSPEEAIAFFEDHDADIAFLDISMVGMDGLTLAKRMRDRKPNMIIIFVTGYSEYALEAMHLHADGYLTKPVHHEDVEHELDSLEQLRRKPEEKKRIHIQCFGNFDVFVGGESIRFGRGRTKELLAYLVDRQGASCTMGEVMAVLWEDKPDTLSQRSQLRTLIADLRATLKEYGAENIIVKNRNELSVDTSLFDCDYYRFMRGDLAAVNLYQGEYMSQYSWPEMRIPSIIRR